MQAAVAGLGKVFGVWVLFAVVGPASTSAAVQVLKVYGAVQYSVGLLAPSKPVTQSTKLEPFMFISASDGAYVDLQFVESGSLVRLTSGTSVTLEADGMKLHRKGAAWSINLTVHSGRVVAIPMFRDEGSHLTMSAQRRPGGDAVSCGASGVGSAFSFSFEGQCIALTGAIGTGVACGNGPSYVFHHVYPPDHKMAEQLKLMQDRWNKKRPVDKTGLEMEVSDLRKNSFTFL